MHLGFGFMIISIVFFLGLLSGVINSRSVTETRKIHNAPYGLIPIGQKPLATIVGFLGGPIAISAIVIWGFISLKWYFVIISWIICGAICRLFVEKKFKGRMLNLNILGVTVDTYEKYKFCREAEHQIGRFLNMQKVLNEIEINNIRGDIVEFGTWQGQGLMLFDIALSKKTQRKLIGIDSFEGLPETSTIWKKGDFSNTSFIWLKKRTLVARKQFNVYFTIEAPSRSV